MNYVYDKLMQYSKDNYRPFHMPGHKRNTDMMQMCNPYEIDITEIDGFDNLHDAKEILKQAMERTARLYGAEESFFLVNGSSCGILAGIGACTSHGDKILVARNSHKSVYNAIYQGELNAVYLYPEIEKEWGIQGVITPEMVRSFLEKEKDICMVVVTSPTYEGILSDIEGIAAAAHEYNIPLLVDGAHGAHMGIKKDGEPLNEDFAASAMEAGADLVVQSVHKTLPAFTQTAIMHVQGNLVNRRKLHSQLGIYQSSSPSYVLMAGIDNCMEMLEEKGETVLKKWSDRLDYFYMEMKKLRHLRILEMPVDRKDKSKLVISTRYADINGHELYRQLLENYHIQAEMESGDYIILMTGAGDCMEDMQYLAKALLEIDEETDITEKEVGIERIRSEYKTMHRKMNIYEAQESPCEYVDRKDCIGRVAADYVYLYPPGIPLVVPGEEITKECVDLWDDYMEKGLELKGLELKVAQCDGQQKEIEENRKLQCWTVLCVAENN